MYKFSSKTGGFYPTALLDIYQRAGTLPDDLIDVEDIIYKKFTGQAPAGKILGVDDCGLPAWVDSPPSTLTNIAAQARGYRDEFLTATDPMTLIDYSIGDVPLSEEQRAQVLAARQAFKAWPTQLNWPLIDLPELPYWLLIEAVNRGYRVPNWPPEVPL